MIEMLAVMSEEGDWFVYHAVRPTAKALQELKLP